MVKYWETVIGEETLSSCWSSLDWMGFWIKMLSWRGSYGEFWFKMLGRRRKFKKKKC